MPFVDLKLAGEVNLKQRKELTKKITEVISEVTGKSPESVYIVIEEVKRDYWGVGGKLLSN